jgi:UDP-N-acetylglucosamine 2-epimerase (non-hydrolysing)
LKIAVIVGTRPEIIKMSPVIRELSLRKADFLIIHTGQHYSYNMDRVFFENLKLPHARYNLEVGSGPHGEQTAKILSGIEKVYLTEIPDIVLVQGDTNTVLAGALAASKLHIKIGHIEAGLRSYDKRMPEEINRILTDHCSDYLFAPTEKARNILLGEGIAASQVYVTGNTVVDAVYQNLEIASANGDILKTLNLQPQQYMLLTLHRQENVDDYSRLKSILDGIDRLSDNTALPVFYPIHPRSRKMMDEFKLIPRHITLIEPLDFLAFIQLEKQARLVLTDSGGVQEESCILGTPCVTLRDNTERPETLELGANRLAGADSQMILRTAEIMLKEKRVWQNPFGDGKAAKRIIDIINLS